MEAKEKLGELINSLDNLAHALKMNIPESIHVQAMRKLLPEKVKEFKEVYIELTGENPWE